MTTIPRAQGILYARYQTTVFEDFYNGASGSAIAATTSGTGAAVAGFTSDAANHPGIAEMTTGTDTTGRAGVLSSGLSLRLGGGTLDMSCSVQIPTLSDGTDTFIFRVGLIDLTSGASTDGVYFEYAQATDTKWQTVTANNSSRTATVTGTTVTAGQWYNLRLNVNAAGTNVDFWIDEVAGTAHTANIPTASGRVTGIGAGIVKSAGTTARTALIDYLAFSYGFSTPR